MSIANAKVGMPQRSPDFSSRIKMTFDFRQKCGDKTLLYIRAKTSIPEKLGAP
ncbi:hypothetical protein ANRL1_04184 [Anaerolineae bacterium]|nr:hypothetical protein ANRL1_04184 [Anaerolineae bacterium]